MLWSPAAMTLLAAPALAEGGEHDLGTHMPLWTLIPFIGILLCIAVLPLVAGHWWEHNKNKGIVAAIFAVPVAAYMLMSHGAAGGHVLLEKGHEYASFIVLLGSLFVITGGIYIRGSLSGTPLVNTAIMAIGGVLASAIGTTGASVLLIRPLLRANAPRTRKVHIVVFFIFIVSNCGGLLTPLGDPPLFLGFLKGVPFEWTLQLWREWLLINGALLVLFNVWDQRVLNAEEKARPGSQLEEVQKHEPFAIEGGLNFLFLLGVVFAIYGSGSGLFNGGKPWPIGIQEGLMVLFGVLAWFSTNKANREANRFSWTPIVEVAVLFAGIFICMAPALLILNSWGQGARDVAGMKFGMTEPWQFFWGSGALSSFLDNAPTYLTFAATAAGMNGVAVDGAHYLGDLLQKGPAAVALMQAISCGAVMMGANTYIGNGPNFMVKAIAEENGVKMPGFFGYMVYSCCILLPLFGLVTFLFFL
ncbi:MAG: sodium:proton antiporter [Planctomycetes bacterium]|nr:sodium:proton antiporter [Planctomycetota bacterium]